MSRTNRQSLGALLGIALLVAVALFALRALPDNGSAAPAATASPRGTAVSQASRAPQPTQAAKPTSQARQPTRAPQAVGQSGLPTTNADELPPEARTTLKLIAQGGPFPYSRDGVVFQNREGRLPKRERGYYHEYTVVTPGEDDRGARRVIAGRNGELFYTADHYDTFVEIVP